MKLAVVMPVYNEEVVVAQVIDEWISALERIGIDYTLFAINDGSKDNTPVILAELADKYQNKIAVINKPNSGHGQSCIYGYRHVINAGYDWVFQIDSDGQCDPRFFDELLKASEKYTCIYGFRKTREDGYKRYIISRFVSLFVYAATGIWVRDANVPYRLMHKSALINITEKIPATFYLANILVSALQQKETGIHWVNINFRDRLGGQASVKAFSFLKHGVKLFKSLRKISV